MRNNIILFILAVIIVIIAVNVRSCEPEHTGNNTDVLKKHEQKKETIKANIVIEEKKVLRVKEQNATIKGRLTVAKKGLILDVDTLLGDTSKIIQIISVIELQGMTISSDSTIIALQDTLISHYKQLDSTNTNIIQEQKEVAKEDIKKAKKKGFKNGLVAGVVTAIVVFATFVITTIK